MLEPERERYRFTAEDYMQMACAGVPGSNIRVELIDGDFYLMSPNNPPHQRSVDWLTRKLVMWLGESAIVRVQGPVHLQEHDVPQPDIAVLRNDSSFYAGVHPRPEDVLLVIEVADNTVRTDRYVKVPKYGAAGIREAWLVDLVHRMVLVHTEPQEDGYGTVKTLKTGDMASPGAFRELQLNVAELLG
jgi:Uma2 family endonuclease